MSDIVLASTNPGKIAEFQFLCNPMGFNIIPQQQLNISEIEETACTFVENALIKARHASSQAKLPAIADDSGLEIDALHGAPGVYSARFAKNPAENNQKVLELMRDIPIHARTARFYCVLVYLKHATVATPLICQATWEGQILTAPQGSQGFGYDPLFYVSTHHCSAAELSPQDKNQISHRGQAMAALQQALIRLQQTQG